jgi:hypothetical protein
MYTTIRHLTGNTIMTCSECGHAMHMNQICERPIQVATQTLKHLATHNVARAFAAKLRNMAPDPALAIAEIAPLSVSFS